MNIKVREVDEIVVLDLEGNLDINASNFIEVVGWSLMNKSTDILCNFEGVNVVDYVGVSVIAVAYKNVLNHNGKMKLYNIPVHVRKLFAVVGLDQVFERYESEDDALQSFKDDTKISQILKKQLRRRFQRIAVRRDIEYKQKFSPKDTFFKGKMIDLSALGMFVIADVIFSMGEIVSTRLHLLPVPGIIELDAKVVWVADKEIQPTEYPGMGLEFYNISSEQQQIIIDFVEKNFAHNDS